MSDTRDYTTPYTAAELDGMEAAFKDEPGSWSPRNTRLLATIRERERSLSEETIRRERAEAVADSWLLGDIDTFSGFADAQGWRDGSSEHEQFPESVQDTFDYLISRGLIVMHPEKPHVWKEAAK